MPLRTAARITALRPGQSPPPVRIPTFMPTLGRREDSAADMRQRPLQGIKSPLAQRLLDFLQPVGPLQYLSRLGTVRRAHDAVALHQVDEVSCAPIADAQAALQQGSGRLAELEHEPH